MSNKKICTTFGKLTIGCFVHRCVFKRSL